MRSLVIYHSETGNTAPVAKTLAVKLKALVNFAGPFHHGALFRAGRILARIQKEYEY